MDIQEEFDKAYEDIKTKDLSSMRAFSIGLTYMIGYGIVTSMEADYEVIYLNANEELLSVPSIRHLVSLGFHYDDGIKFYT